MNRKQIVLADTMGYCWGVRRTLEIIEAAGDLANPVATIGDSHFARREGSGCASRRTLMSGSRLRGRRCGPVLRWRE